MKERTRDALFLWALAGIVALGGLLRCVKLDASLWLDEILTYQRAKGTLGYCLMSLTTPLHEMITHFSLKLGHHEVFLRLPNVIAGLCTIALIYFAARSLYGKVTGLVAALLLATSAYHVHHSQWARYYALMMLTGLLWIWLLDRCVTRGGALNWVSFTLTCFFGLLVHQFCLPFLAAMSFGAGVWVIVSRSVQGARPKLLKLGLLALCVVIGFSGFGGILIAQGKTPLQKLVAEQGVAQDTQAPAAGQGEAETPSQLTVATYAQYLTEMFSFLREWHKAKYLLLFLGVWGFLVTLRKRPSFALIAFSAFCLMPIPLFVLRVSHQYGNRYFCMLVPIGYLLIAVGIVSLARWAASRMPHRRLMGHLLVIPLLVLLTPTTVNGLQRYYHWHPAWDWKGVARYMTQTMTPNDILYFIDPSHSQFNMTLTGFYMESFLKDSETYLFSVKEFLADLDEPTLMRLTSDFPKSTLWFCAEAGQEGPAGNLLDRVCKTKRTFNGVYVWCLGEPTTNLMHNAGFEDPNAKAESPEAFAAIVAGPEAYEGERCMRLNLSDFGARQVQFRVNTPGYNVSCLERNPGFEAWTRDRPVGWDVPGPSARFVQRTGEARSGRSALALIEAPEAVAVGQGIATGFAPGNVVEVSAQGKADAANQLGIELNYRIPEGPRRQVVYHPGGGTWAPLVLREKLPPNVAPTGLRVCIIREPGAAGTVIVDDVQASVLGIKESLDPAKTYTLSMMLRYEGLRSQYEASNTWSAASVMLSYVRPEGNEEARHLMRFYGDSAWRPVVFQLKPGRDIPYGASWLMVSVAMYGKGTIWIDNLQLEAKDHPTPFVDGVRLPHDEYLAQELVR